jgi:leucyl-tRNA synthetase
VEADETLVRELALKREKVKRHLEGKEIKKVIYVPGRLINFVAR